MKNQKRKPGSSPTGEAVKESVSATTTDAETSERLAETRHEVNNLLTGILGQSQLLLLRDDLDDAARERVKMIEDLVKRIKISVASLNDL